jgi:hypothetical protein
VYFYAILFYFVDYGIPLSQIKIVLFILANRECLIKRRRCININHFALQELNISQNNFHLPLWASWVPFSLARRLISLAPGNRATFAVF